MFLKKLRTWEKLTKALTLIADEKLRKIAIERQDENVIASTSRDIVAAEAHYHVYCYRNCTRVQENSSDNTSNFDTQYEANEKEAFSELFEHIRTTLLPNKRVTYMSVLVEKFESILQGNT